MTKCNSYISFVTLILIVIAPFKLLAQPQDLVYTALPPMGQSDPSAEFFGQEHALYGNHAVVCNKNFYKNQVFFYKKNENGEWKFNHEVIESSINSNNHFGFDCDMNERFTVVGALDSIKLQGTLMERVGSVTVYTLKNEKWEHTQRIIAPDPEAIGLFGRSVELNKNWLFIGSRSNLDQNGNNNKREVGAVYIYQLDSDTFKFHSKIVPPLRFEGISFGYSLKAFESDLVINAILDDYDANNSSLGHSCGSVYYYKLEGNTWLFKQKIVPFDHEEYDNFGVRLAINGDKLIVSSRTSLDENGDNYLYKSGAIYYYKKINEVWEFKQKLTAANRSYDAYFGLDMALLNSELICFSGFHTDPVTGNPFSRSGYNAYSLTNDLWTFSHSYWASPDDLSKLMVGEISYNGTTLMLSNYRNSKVHFYEVPYLPPFIGNDTTICSDDSLIIHSQYNADSFPHLWLDGSRDSFLYISDSGKYELEVDFNGTKLRDTIHIGHHPQAQVYVGPDTAFCGLFEYTIKAKGEDLHSYQWSNGDSLEYTVAFQAGMYHVRVQDSLNCPGGDTMQLEASDPPEIQLIPDTFTCNNASLTIAVEQNQDYKYLWSTGSLSHSTIITDTGWYSLSVSRPFCEVIDSIYVYEFCPPKPQYWIPNAFSPDLNNLNEKFRPTTVNIDSYTISIFNRWGECIYSGNEGWDGIYEGKLCQAGVYVYMIEINAERMKRFEHGTFTLLR
ncbi:T9SS type B sorting domain-containing protein [bacterium]|nr:T9SS type B sorting domain-containing protein [bacterium]